MDELAPAKINLALHVLGRRPDGYHELDSIVAFADVADRLTIHQVTGTTSVSIRGPFAGGLCGSEENLVLSAHAMLQEWARLNGAHLPEVAFSLEKNLPVAAGIGGGSADAAAALRALVRFFSLSVPEKDLQALALRLGADVPVCLASTASRMRGIGEQLQPLPSSGKQAAVLVNPGVTSSTAAVFGKLGLTPGQRHRPPLDPADPATWRNDLQDAATGLVPEIAEVIAALAAEKRISIARMSGSGATCFGIADSLVDAREAAANLLERFPRWWVRAVLLS